MGRAPCCDKANVKKGPWSPEEDAKLKSSIEQHGTGGNWIALPQKIGLKRCGKSCRLRWLNYLRPDIKHGDFSEEEDKIICRLYISIGSRWSVIASQMPGRTDNDVKNYWNTRLKKKLLGGRPHKEQQHRRRRAAGSSKQVAEEAEKRNFTATADDGCQASYCAQAPMNYVNQDSPAAAAAAAHHPWQLPIELGGWFSDDGTPNVQSPLRALPTPLPAHHISHSSLNDLIPPSTRASSFDSNPSPLDGGHMLLQGAGDFLMTELEKMLCCNPLKLEGLEGFYGVDDMVISESNGTSSSESLSWEEMSPLICPRLISDYHPMHPAQQQRLFEEQLNPRMQ